MSDRPPQVVDYLTRATKQPWSRRKRIAVAVVAVIIIFVVFQIWVGAVFVVSNFKR